MVCNRWHQHIALTHGLKQIRLVHGAIMLVQGNVKEFTHPSLHRRREPTGDDDLWMSGARSFQHKLADRKSVVWGRSVSVRVELGGRRIIKKETREVLRKNRTYQRNKGYTNDLKQEHKNKK